MLRKPRTLVSLFLVLPLVLLFQITPAYSQENSEPSTVSYALRHTTTTNVANVFRPLVANTPSVSLQIDTDRQRIRVTGPQWAHDLMDQILLRIDQPTQPPVPETNPSLATNSGANSPTSPPLSNSSVSSQTGSATQLMPPVTRPSSSDAAAIEASRSTESSPSNPSSQTTRLTFSDSSSSTSSADVRRQLVPLPRGTSPAVRRDLLLLFSNRLQVSADPRLPWVLPTPSGPLHIEISVGREDVLVDGPANVVAQFMRLLDSITQRYVRPAEGTPAERPQQKVLLLNRSVQGDVERVLNDAAPRSPQQLSWGPEQALRGPSRLADQTPSDQLILRLAGAQQQPPSDPAPPVNSAGQPSDGRSPGDAGNPQLGQTIPAQPVPAQAIPALGGGPTLPQLEGVDVELLPDLDAIILKGRDQDLEQLAEIIQQLEQLSRETQPAVEVVHLRYSNSNQLAELIEDTAEDLIGTRQGRAQMTPLGKPNAILLIGWGEAVTAIKELIGKLDRPVNPETQFQIFSLKYASAATLQTTITNFFSGRDGALGTIVESTVDARTNTLIVHAAPRDLAEVAALVARLDTPSGRSVLQTRVFTILNSLAADVADTLEDALQGAPTNARSAALELILPQGEKVRSLLSGSLENVQITVDQRKNSLIISTFAENFEVIEALIQQLDAPGLVAKIKIFPVVNSDASSLVETLRSLLPSQTGTTASTVAQLSSAPGESSLAPLRFTVDVRSNSIIATGSEGDLQIVDALITRLDETDAMKRKNLVYQLKNSPAVDVALAINEFLRNTRQVENASPGTINPYEQLEKEVVVVPEPVSNKLIVSATDRYFSEIEQMIENLDAQPPQVMIQALIAEIALDDTEEFGIELGIQDSVLFDRSLLGDLVTVTSTTQNSTPSGIATQTDQNIVAATNVPGFDFNSTLPLGNSGSAKALNSANAVGGQGLSNFAVGRGNAELGFGGLVLSASSQNINVLLRALEESRRLEILSRPQVLTLDNQPAFIQVGQRVPRIIGSSINQVGQQNTVDLENVGLILGVTPRISPEGNVTMEIDAEKSSIGPENEGIPVSVSADGTVIRSPRVDVTSAQATVSAANGETIILGGLITNSRREIHRKVPFLGDIPVVRHLFRFDSMSNRRTELLIILTPYIVRTPEDSQRLKEVEMARMNWCAADVFELHGEAFAAPDHSLLFENDTEVETVYPHVDPRGSRVEKAQPITLDDKDSSPDRKNSAALDRVPRASPDKNTYDLEPLPSPMNAPINAPK